MKRLKKTARHLPCTNVIAGVFVFVQATKTLVVPKDCLSGLVFASFWSRKPMGCCSPMSLQFD